MKNRISFLAVGQAGGNIGLKFEQKGYKVLYINTSREDLDTLGTAKFKHHIKDGEGSNHDRKKAKKAVIDDYDAISRKIIEGLDTEFVYTIFSSGGGTGSGAAPMLADLILGDIAEDNAGKIKNVGTITILPSLKEPVKTQINSYECFMELSKIKGLSSSFIIDNETGDKMVLNHQFVNTLTAYLDIPNKHKSDRGNIDKAEIMETIKVTGMNKIIQIPAKESSTENIIECFNKTLYAPSENDGVIKYISVSQAGTKFDIDILQRETGMPVDVFRTYNEHSTICCLSGLTFPNTRLEKTYEVINENKDKVMKALSADTSIKVRDGIDFLQDSVRGSSVQSQRKNSESGTRTSRRDIMDKYL